jgi:drug/metabolite transporter (DMT)-like permease
LFYGILLSLLTCCCWGSTSVCMRGLTKIDSYDMSVLRAVGCFIASLALAVFFSSFSSLGAVPLKVLFVFIPMVLFNNIIGDVFLFLSLHTLGVARGSAISSTYPVVVAIASAIFFGEKLTLPVVAGTLLVVVGVMCLCQKDGPKMPVSAKGLTYAILASLFWGLGIMCTKDLVANGLTPDEVTFGRSVLFIIFALVLWIVKFAKLDTRRQKNVPWRDLQPQVMAWCAGRIPVSWLRHMVLLKCHRIHPYFSRYADLRGKPIACHHCRILHIQ